MALSNLKIEPENVLTFEQREAQPQTTLQLTNVSACPVIYKIKTTTPDRYLVKPNHGLVTGGESARVTIVLVKDKEKEMWHRAKSEKPIKRQDKFLVQSAEVDAVLANSLGNRPAEIVNEIFREKDRHKICSKKLMVEFLSSNDHESVSSQSQVGKSVSPTFSMKAEAPEPIPTAPDAMFTEIVTLRKKYDDLVAFTVNLISERDRLMLDLAKAKVSVDNTHTVQTVEVMPSSSKSGTEWKKESVNYVPLSPQQLALLCCGCMVFGMLFPTALASSGF